MTTHDPSARLSPAQHARMEAGDHAALASELAEADPALSGWLLERIWDFGAATAAYLRAGEVLAALRAALDHRDPAVLEHVLEYLARPEVSAETRASATDLLARRRRDAEAARVSAMTGDASRQAALLDRAGDHIAAAKVAREAGDLIGALSHLGRMVEAPGAGLRFALAAAIEWELGDAEGAARHAQTALRCAARWGDDLEDDIAGLLARALVALGHPLAAQSVLADRDEGAEPLDAAVTQTTRARFQVSGPLPTFLPGLAYVGIDRLTMAEVEVYLVAADLHESELDSAEVQAALRRFADEVESGRAVGHPAFRAVAHVHDHDGVLILPRAEGPSMRDLIEGRALVGRSERVRAMMAFVLEGLSAAHERGLAHGGIYPSLVVSDRIGRPELPPFGTHALSGLHATRTGALDELIRYSAPELRAGAPPTPASDVYAIGTLWLDLLADAPDRIEGEDAESVTARALVASMRATDPSQRPSARACATRARATIADASRVQRSGPVIRSQLPGAPRARTTASALPSREITVHVSWPDQALDQLCERVWPHLQPILDRRRAGPNTGPRGALILGALGDETEAPGPRACDGPTPADPGFRTMPELLRRELLARLSPVDAVACPGGETMWRLESALGRAAEH